MGFKGTSESEWRIAGSVLYMSPEQAAGCNDGLTEASDWYSVGVMLFEALTGRFPFSGSDVIHRKQEEEPPSLSAFVSDAPEDLVSLTRRLLARNPAARPTGEELLAELSANPENSGDALTSGPFVGRETHLERLEECFTALRQGKSGMVHVFGISGAGKSVLVQRFLQRLCEIKGVVILTGRCYEQESVPYKALDSLIDSLTVYMLAFQPKSAIYCCPITSPLWPRYSPCLHACRASSALSSTRLPIPSNCAALHSRCYATCCAASDCAVVWSST